MTLRIHQKKDRDIQTVPDTCDRQANHFFPHFAFVWGGGSSRRLGEFALEWADHYETRPCEYGCIFCLNKEQLTVPQCLLTVNFPLPPLGFLLLPFFRCRAELSSQESFAAGGCLEQTGGVSVALFVGRFRRTSRIVPSNCGQVDSTGATTVVQSFSIPLKAGKTRGVHRVCSCFFYQSFFWPSWWPCAACFASVCPDFRAAPSFANKGKNFLGGIFGKRKR